MHNRKNTIKDDRDVLFSSFYISNKAGGFVTHPDGKILL